MTEVLWITKDQKYRTIYVPDDLGKKYRLQRNENDHWKSIVYFDSVGEAWVYWEMSGHREISWQ